MGQEECFIQTGESRVMKFKSIQMKIAFIAGLCLLLTISSLVVVGLVSSNKTRQYTLAKVSDLQQKSALDNLEHLAEGEAGKLQANFDMALDAARTLAHVFAVGKQADVTGKPLVNLDRGEVNAILLKVLQQNPELNGTYTCWEPNAFDGRDEDFRTGKDGNNAATGRFTPYWTRDEQGNIAVQPLVEYDTMDKHPNGVLKGGWYIRPRETLTESVLDPFPYVVQGKKVWLTTLSVPIIVDGKFQGVAGTDFNLNFVQDLSEKVDRQVYEGKGQVTIVSNAGLVVADSEKPQWIGQHVKSALTEGWREILEIVQAGKRSAALDDREGVATAVVPITLGRTGKPWAVMIRIDKAVILAEAMALNDALQVRSKSSVLWQSGISLMIGVFAIAVMWLAAGGIAGPIRRAAGLADTIREGDFSERVDIDSADEVGQLADSLNGMAASLEKAARVADDIAGGNLDVEVSLASGRDQLGHALEKMATSLNEALGQVQVAGEQIASGSAQVSDASQSLSQGATEQASSLEEISASVMEMSSQTTQTAENASQANTLSKQACQVATTGNAHMQDLMAAMGEINSAGQNISKIIKVIDEIAFQTNLLALNAAVEAARAGQHGKGFAVVAEEVRNLAARSAEAARETAEMIEGSVDKAANGVHVAEKTADALKEIVESITKTTDLVSEIAAAAQEQAQGIGQINQGLGQVDQVTQQNTANAEESAAASVELSSQAEQLRQMLARFNMKNQDQAKSLAHNKTVAKVVSAARHSVPEKQNKSQPAGEESEKQGREVPKIALSDDEFGKF
jgi:methyl-accepting chemotaxis protein